MKKIFSFVKQALSREWVRAALAILLGALLLLFRTLMLRPLAILIGGAMMLMAILEGILHLSGEYRRISAFTPGILIDLCLFFSGLYMLFRPAAAIKLVAQLLGVYLFLRMGRRLYLLSFSAKARTPRQVTGLILTALAALGGLVLLFFPARMTSVLTGMLGTAFVLCGFFELVRKRIPRRIGKQRRDDYIETDFIDKSDT